jgi:hypothetical protein
MKFLISLFTLLIVTHSCDPDFNSDDMKLIYTAHSRGYFYEIQLDQKDLKQYENFEKTDENSRKISSKEWSKTLELLNDITLEKFASFMAPTDMRHTDRKPYANLIVIQHNDTLRSNSFDHQHPPKELKTLVEHILSIAEN